MSFSSIHHGPCPSINLIYPCLQNTADIGSHSWWINFCSSILRHVISPLIWHFNPYSYSFSTANDACRNNSAMIGDWLCLTVGECKNNAFRKCLLRISCTFLDFIFSHVLLQQSQLLLVSNRLQWYVWKSMILSRLVSFWPRTTLQFYATGTNDETNHLRTIQISCFSFAFQKSYKGEFYYFNIPYDCFFNTKANDPNCRCQPRNQPCLPVSSQQRYVIVTLKDVYQHSLSPLRFRTLFLGANQETDHGSQ